MAVCSLSQPPHYLQTRHQQGSVVYEEDDELHCCRYKVIAVQPQPPQQASRLLTPGRRDLTRTEMMAGPTYLDVQHYRCLTAATSSINLICPARDIQLLSPLSRPRSDHDNIVQPARIFVPGNMIFPHLAQSRLLNMTLQFSHKGKLHV